MDSKIEQLLEHAYNIGREHEAMSSGGTVDEIYQSGGDFHADFLPTVPERHSIFFARIDFERHLMPSILIAFLESMAVGGKNLSDEMVIGYKFPIFISRDYILSVLQQWGFGK